MLNNLENIYLEHCNLLKLRFTYVIESQKKSYKLDYPVRLLDFDKNIRISIRDFLLSVLTNTVAPFLFLQSQSVKWSTVSIIYESNPKNSKNLYLIPLKSVKGQASKAENVNTDLKIFLRFQNNPRPTTIKIYGISDLIEDDEIIMEKNLKACEKAFIDTFVIENTKVRYHYLNSKNSSFLAKYKKNKAALKSRNMLNIENLYRKPILALTDL